jgi:hypothetical protein
MAFASVNGVAASDARVGIPRLGVWTARVALDADAELDGPCRLELGGVAFEGFARRSGTSEGLRHLQLVGGAGGLRREVEPRGYQSVPLRVPLTDILSTAGEALSPNCSSEVLNTQLAHWATLRGTAGNALVHLLNQVEASWRVLTSGHLWVGFEDWPQNTPEHEVIAEEPVFDRLTVSIESPSIWPGQTFRGRHVSYVLHSLEGDDFLSTVWFE